MTHVPLTPPRHHRGAPHLRPPPVAQDYFAGEQPHPLVDQQTLRAYVVSGMGIFRDPNAQPIRLHCVDLTPSGSATRGPCGPQNVAGMSPWPVGGVTLPVQLINNNALSPIDYVFAGALVPASASAGSRLIYTAIGPYASAILNGPLGCVMTLSDLTGALLETYCVPKTNAAGGLFNSSIFLAGAPVVAANARGVGLHTAFAISLDAYIYAFDPYNIGNGPLYIVTPFPAGEQGSIATDYMSMSPGGALLFNAWRKDVSECEFLEPRPNAPPPFFFSCLLHLRFLFYFAH